MGIRIDRSEVEGGEAGTPRLPWVLPWVLVLGTGCPRSEDGTPASATEGGPATTEVGSAPETMTAAMTEGTATEASATDDTPTEGTPTEETADDTMPPFDTGSTGSDGESSTGEAPIQFCGLEDLKPGAPNPIVFGTGPMQIPPDIATILVDNCVCHYADMLDVGPPVADYSSLLPLKIDTWEQWQGEYGFPGNTQPTIPSVLTRVRDSPLQLAMPHRSCNVGDGEQMVPEQRQILIDWMVAGAPDGATWMP